MSKHRNRKEHSSTAIAMVERIKQVWFEDATYSTLGERLNMAGASIAGYYSRHPELRITHPVLKRASTIKQSDGTTKRNFSQRAARIEAVRTVRSQTNEYDGPHGKYTLVTLPHTGCKWPFGVEPSEMTFCGHTREPGEPYCTAHARLAYTPRAEIQRRKRAAGMQLERLGVR